MEFPTVLGILIICVAAVSGQLFLGPCGLPPKHVADVDFQKYAGVWYVAATTAYNLEKEPCKRMYYMYDEEKGHLNFTSGTKTGHLEKVQRRDQIEIRRTFDNFPRSWHLHVLSVDYDSVAVEYTCLDGVFKKREEVMVLTRQKPKENDVLHPDVSNVIPKELLLQLRPVKHENCPEPLLKPCSRRNVTNPFPYGGCNSLLPSPLLTIAASYANRIL